MIAANMDLLDEGTLHVAKFHEDGKVEWMPLVFGQGPLTEQNGKSQADVLIETRRAGDLLGAGRWIAPRTCSRTRSMAVFTPSCSPTIPSARTIRWMPPIRAPRTPSNRHHRDRGRWSGFCRHDGQVGGAVEMRRSFCGEVGASFSTDTTRNGWFGMPDNAAVDGAGRLWVATDGNSSKDCGRTDGLWAVDTEGDARATSKLFYRVPVGAECAVRCSHPTMRRLSSPCSIGRRRRGLGRSWPSVLLRGPVHPLAGFQDDMPVRPAVVAIASRAAARSRCNDETVGPR